MRGGRRARVFYQSVAAEREGNTYEYFFTVSTDLDGEILLQIQQHLRTDMLTPLMKFVTFLGNGGWFWILCAVVLLLFQRQEKQAMRQFCP